MPTLTKRQKQIYDYIKSYVEKNGLSPTFNEIKKHFKLSAASTVHQHIGALVEKEMLIKNNYNSRGIELNKKNRKDLIKIPLAGTIAAGQPIETFQTNETITVPKNLLSKSGEHFALKVKGDSMIDEGIFDDDTVIIRKQDTIENGETAVALINGNEVTLKKIYKEKNRIRLQPANPNLKPLFVKNVIIQGKVISAFRNIEKIEEEDTILKSDEKSKGLAAIEQKHYFNRNNFVLYHSDCVSMLNSMKENSVDMIFADPPYLLSNGGFSVHAGRRVSVDKGEWDKSNGLKKDFEFHLEWIQAARRVLKPHGTIWISGTYHSIYQCGFAVQVAKFHILNDIAWFKPNASPNLSCRYFTASHETLLWARKDKNAKHAFDYDLMKNGNWPEDQLKKPGFQMRSVWAMGTPKRIEKKFGKHPTQKPEDLLKRIILASTNKDDLVVDPFTGSSTTGIASHLLGRRFIGIDTEKKYLDLSIKRFEELERNLKNPSN
ncbi:MAG: DNA modification methylase [Parcubacteria group bacterium Athens1014_10]|nr:MAG: DNA modification methylase [Parcubacteria group bacterium Athens1014_10]TSD06091.1 MAG: DNA modification methylase [Parcubacteria group bacterium Athens0714_12]